MSETMAVASALLRAGARPIIAARRGPRVADIRALGCEFVELNCGAGVPWLATHRTRRLSALAARERVDIIHAVGEEAARYAGRAFRNAEPHLVVTLDDHWRMHRRRDAHVALADAVIIRHGDDATRASDRGKADVTVIPYAVDTNSFSTSAVSSERTASLREAWRVEPGERVVLAPGVVAPGAMHDVVLAAAHILRKRGIGDVVYAIPGDREGKRRHMRALARRVAAQGLSDIVCLGAPTSDARVLLSAADFVVAPCTPTPWTNRIAAQAQAMGRPVILGRSASGSEALAAPPRMPASLRTGWLVKPNDPLDLGLTLAAALALDAQERARISRRAREFAVTTFSPTSVAAATLAVYTSVLEARA